MLLADPRPDASLRGECNGIPRNVIIMWNTIYAANKLAEKRVMFSRQFCKSSSFFEAATKQKHQGLYRLISG